MLTTRPPAPVASQSRRLRAGLSGRRLPTRAGLRTGAVTTETAVILTVWVSLFVGIFDASSLTMRHNLLSHLARQGARLAIVRGEYSEPELATWGPATMQGSLSDDSDFARLIRGSLAGMHSEDFTYKLEWIDGGNEIEQRVRVTISVAYLPMFRMGFGQAPIRMSATSVMPISH